MEIKFKRIDATVLSFEPPKILVRWVLEPTVLPLQNYKFKIERSEAQHDGYALIQTVTGTTPNYLDMTTELHNVQKRYYYRVSALNIKTNQIVSVSVGTWEGEPSLVAAEMRRLLDFLLDDRTGEPTFVFNQMNDGAKCPECWDYATSRVRDPDCTTCNGTGKFGGYYTPYLAMIDFFPDPMITQHSGWGESQETQMDILLSAYPPLKNQDILIKASSNKTYIVENIRGIEEPGSDTLIHQIARVSEVNRTDITTRLIIPDELRVQAADRLRRRKELREF